MRRTGKTDPNAAATGVGAARSEQQRPEYGWLWAGHRHILYARGIDDDVDGEEVYCVYADR